MDALIEPPRKSGEPQPLPKTPSYPTRTLEFLRTIKNPRKNPEVQEVRHSTDGGREPLKFKVLITGAGLGGLATAIALAKHGHKVTILEQAPQLGEVGAGIQVPPNSSKLLLKWGLEPLIKEKAIEPKKITFARWQDGKVIGLTNLENVRQVYGAPYYLIHRAHFHDAMHKLAVESGVELLVDHKVVDYDEDAPSVTVANGRTYTADLIIAADGINSIARRKISGQEQPPFSTGYSAFRATVDVEKMRADPDTAELLKQPDQKMWIGGDRHVMTYTISGGKSFNMVACHIDHSDPKNFKAETALSEMKACYEGWDPTLTKVIGMIDKTMKWPLMSGDRLDRWVSDSGRLLILGDAAHAMLPYMSQGAAMAVEDGAALAQALSKVHDKADLKPALHVFEKVRSERSYQMQEASFVNGMLWHFYDGPEQAARDAAMRPDVEGRQVDSSPNAWTDPTTQRWAYGHDPLQAIDEAWDVAVAAGKQPKPPTDTISSRL